MKHTLKNTICKILPLSIVIIRLAMLLLLYQKIIFSDLYIVLQIGCDITCMLCWKYTKHQSRIFQIITTLLILLANVTSHSFFIAGIILTFMMACDFIIIITAVVRLIFFKLNHKYPVKMVLRCSLSVLVLFIIFNIVCALQSYKKQPQMSEDEISEISNDMWKEKNVPEKALLIEDNGEALCKRIQLIRSAKEHIILSTFEFKNDTSGSIMLGALIDAAERGVDIKIIVDGFSGMYDMEWNPYFYALSSYANVTIKLYNPVNLFTPWKYMGRLHDKYLIIDQNAYVIGGRNTYDFFLGDQAGHKNYDRDVLVYCENPDESSSVNELMDYFDSVWTYDESKEYGKKTSFLQKSLLAKAKEQLTDRYLNYLNSTPSAAYDSYICSDMVVVDNISLLSNPIEYTSKKPVVWEELLFLMNNATDTVRIHTPYIICNKYMYDGLSNITGNVKNVSVMTNSAANNGNPFGSADYIQEKYRLLKTGVKILEYEGGVSYHGKSILIDDNISIIGSFNMDMRSAYLDTELMLVIDSQAFNSKLKESMDYYESSARIATGVTFYDNPNNVTPVAMTTKKRRQISLITRFLEKYRYLF